MRAWPILAVIVLFAADARALDPARAETDANAAREEAAQFCASPKKPLSSAARRLCGHAKEIPSCAAFVAACAESEGNVPTAPTAPSTPPSSPSVVTSGIGAVAQMIVWLIVAGVVALVVALVVRALLAMRKDDKLADPAMPKVAKIETATPEPLAQPSDAEALLARADAHARGGELDAALFTYLAAALRALDHRGAIRLSRDRTNGEYVRGCREDAARAPLRAIVGDVDRAQFGGVAADASVVARAKDRATALVRAVPVAMLAVFAFAIASLACASPPPPPPIKSDDPAGTEMFVSLMRKQGVTVARATSSLATLPMPKDRADAPTVVIDTERITLDEETAAHLMRWVEAGGSLVLAGRAESWPKELGAAPRAAMGDRVNVFDVAKPQTATVVRSAAIAWTHTPLAAFAGGETYAGMRPMKDGVVLALATDELLTNAALARPGNAGALVAILEAIDPHEITLARAEDAIAPPSNPISGMIRAGLGLGLGHGLVFAIVLFLAAGVRLARPRPTPPPARRAFAESVEASGALYARANMAAHALAAYARFIEERLRARMSRCDSDVTAFLAARAGADPAHCEELWQRAKNAREPRGDELALLKELTALYARAK